MNEIEKAMSATAIGDTVTLREIKENTYIRKKRGMQLVSSKEIESKIINNHPLHHLSQV